MQITSQHNSLKTRITPKLATAFIYLIYKQSTFLRDKVIGVLPNATVLCPVMVIITRKTILNEKVGYHFCQVILLFWLRQKMVQYTKYKIEEYRNYEYYYQKLWRPLEKRQTTPRGCVIMLKTTALEVVRISLVTRQS